MCEDKLRLITFFSFILTHPSVRGEKNSFTHEAIFKKVFYKKQLVKLLVKLH